MNKRAAKSLLMIVMICLLASACGAANPETGLPTDIPTALPQNEATVSVEDLPTAVPSQNPIEVSPYEGLTYPPLPVNLTAGFSMLIQGAEGHSLLMVTEGNRSMLWLGKFAEYDKKGSPLWHVKDVLDLSRFGPNLMLIPDGCSLNSAPDGRILVIVRGSEVVIAWRVNTITDRFETTPSAGIHCVSDKAVQIP